MVCLVSMTSVYGEPHCVSGDGTDLIHNLTQARCLFSETD